MSASKEALARPRLDFVRVSRQHPCPACGHDGFCRVTADGREAWCMRCDEGHDRVYGSSIGPMYVHRLDGARSAALPRVLPPTEARVERAPAALLDRAYRVVLAQLRLDTSDREALLARGLDSRGVAAEAFRSTRSESPARIARAVVTALGEEAARRVPGIVWRHRTGEDPTRGWWHWRAAVGVLIPVRDLEGRVVALKVRRCDESDSPYGRYVYVSSAARRVREGEPQRYVDLPGPSALCAVHVPVEARALRDTKTRLVITEGELKAAVAAALLHEPVVSIPGVSAWAAGVDLAVLWGAREVVVAFDMDATTNRFVAKALGVLVSELRQEGISVRVWRWPYDGTRWKGLDDYLLATRGEKREVSHGC
jgi:Domain of unknown function (DUF3854)